VQQTTTAMDVDPEVCEEEVMETIAEMSSTELVNLCLELGLTGYEAIKEKKVKMHKFVMKYLVELETSEADEGAAKFVQIYNYLKVNPTQLATSLAEKEKFMEQLEQVLGKEKEKEEQPAPAATTAVKAEVKPTDVTSSISQADPDALLKLLQQQLEQKVTPQQPKTSPVKTEVKPDLITSLVQANPELLLKLLLGQQKKEVKPMVMKDLKFTGGVIAEEGEKTGDKTRFSFSTLCYKIRNAEKQKYPEPVICNAIVDAIVPSNPLKTYFEMRPDLTIKAMLSKLKNLYKEKGSTDTLLELSRAVQYSSAESCMEFCGRLMCLRDKYILLSKEENAAMDARMAGLAETFMKSLFLGMRNGNVRNELRESCKNLYKGKEPDADDDILLELIADAMANEKEREKRLLEGKKAEVNMMQTNAVLKEMNKTNSRSRDSEKKEKSIPLTQLEELRLEQKVQAEAITAMGTQLSEIAGVLVKKSDVEAATLPSWRPLLTSSAPAPGFHLQQQGQNPQRWNMNQQNRAQFPQQNQFQSPRPNNFHNQSAFQQAAYQQPFRPTAQIQQPFQAPDQHNLPQSPQQQQQPHQQPNTTTQTTPATQTPPLNQFGSQPPNNQWQMNPNQAYPPNQNQYPPYVPPHRRRSSRCQNCEATNQVRCRHCFKCGSDQHRYNVCPN
jgi:hypothetical protein